MVPQEATVAARAAAVMVRVHGPDPKGRKMWNHVFHHSESGDTTLSASGWLLHDGSRAVERDSSIVVLTCATIVEPFLQKAPLPGGSTTQFQRTPILIPHAEVDILIEDFEQSQLHGQANDGPHHDSKHSSSWIPAKLVGLVDIPLAGMALQALLDAHGGSLDGAWEIGWALAHVETSRLQGPNPLSHKKSDQPVLSKSYDLHAVTDRESIIDNMASATTRIAVLSMHTPKMKIMPGMVLAKPCKRGDFLLVVGSPFGALSPLHFFNSMVVGIIANCWPPASPQASLLMADLRCLPGMEGAPAFNGDGAFIGMLTTPLRQRGGGAEVQLVITWEALAPALRDIGIDLQACFPEVHNDYATPSSCEERVIKAPRSLGQREGLHGSRHHVHLSPSIDETVGSVVLVTVGDGAWASGVLVNDKGLILTNAHLLEPWRFGKTQFSQSQGERGLAGLANASQIEDLRSSRRAISTCMAVSDSSKGFEKLIEKIDMPFSVGNLGLQTNVQADELVNYAANDGVVVQPALEINYRSYRKIRVRLEHPIPRTWYDARAVYVSRGPLDIALLQLGTVLAGLRPIKPEEEYPFPGTTAVVIGHGLFGPRSDLCPSLSAGVVSRVVKAGSLSQLGSSPEVESPAMLETTAAVHPGASGGAVVNEHGRMIGLVTSNARHSGGTVIPHLNFSIPYAALKPIFSYASGDMKDPSSLSALGRPNEQFSAVWALVPPTPPRPTQVLPFLPKPPNTDSSTLHGQKPEPNRQKGSRFAKFLTEKKVDLFKQSQLMHDAGNDQVSKDRMNPPKTVVPGEVIHSRI